jgi:hypothetical protein
VATDSVGTASVGVCAAARALKTKAPKKLVKKRDVRSNRFIVVLVAVRRAY